MDKVLRSINEAFADRVPSYESLGKVVYGLDWSRIEYEKLIPHIEDVTQYSRHILQLEPVECVLLHWPAQVASAIHFHSGFWGYVVVLEGVCDNITYQLNGDKLRENKSMRALEGGIIHEPVATVHKILNPSKIDRLVTLHLYYPALDNLDGLVLYGEDGTVGILNKDAVTASFDEPVSHFKSIQPKHLKIEHYAYSTNAKSHRIYPIIPKPDKIFINKMIGKYYCEQAEEYDMFDFEHPTRKKYTERINELIMSDIDSMDCLDNFLALACGTGRRPSAILERSRHNFHITGVDLSEKMCEISRGRGLTVYQGDWLSVDFTKNDFDVCTFLYAFGHISSHKERLGALMKIRDKLRVGGVLFIDVFNINDRYEWGQHAVRRYEEHDLDKWGYEKGDVFYKKTEGEQVAFLHYFDESKLRTLFEESGFEVERIDHVGYVHRSGEVLTSPDQGSLFVKAIKK